MNNFVYALVPIFAFLLAQGIKTVLHYFKWGKFNAERLMGAGGMPSSHSAGVCSLIALVGLIDTIYSTEFAIAVIFGLVVMYDATGVRRAAGRHAKAINELRRNSPNPRGADKTLETESAMTGDDDNLKEYIGHTPLQVFCGSILGFAIGVGAYYLFGL